MSYNVIMILIGWLFALAIFLGFIVLLRYLQHRERMALITRGIHPDSIKKQRRNKGLLRAGLITMMVGLAVTIGLYPIGFLLPTTLTTAPLHLGPWLLPGLIPLAVGLALTISYYLEQNTAPPQEEGGDKPIPIEEHLERRQRGHHQP